MMTSFFIVMLLFSSFASIPFFNAYGLHEEPIISGEPKPPYYFKKFVGYGYNPKIETEVPGIVAYVESNIFYLVPNQSYYNLLLPGNYLHPLCSGYDTNYAKTFRGDILGPYLDAACAKEDVFRKIQQNLKSLGYTPKSLNELGFGFKSSHLDTGD